MIATPPLAIVYLDRVLDAAAAVRDLVLAAYHYLASLAVEARETLAAWLRARQVEPADLDPDEAYVNQWRRGQPGAPS